MNCDSCVRKLHSASVSIQYSFQSLFLNPFIFHTHQFWFLITTLTFTSTDWNLSHSTVSNRTDAAQSQCSSTQARHSPFLYICLKILPACPYSPPTFFPIEKTHSVYKTETLPYSDLLKISCL